MCHESTAWVLDSLGGTSGVVFARLVRGHVLAHTLTRERPAIMRVNDDQCITTLLAPLLLVCDAV
jgi:hypothetical protein